MNYLRYGKLERPIMFVHGINESVKELSSGRGRA
jgi:hypothetical protein